MSNDKPSAPRTDVLRERDAGRPKDVHDHAPRRQPADPDPQFPGGEYPANDRPLPGERDDAARRR